MAFLDVFPRAQFEGAENGIKLVQNGFKFKEEINSIIKHHRKIGWHIFWDQIELIASSAKRQEVEKLQQEISDLNSAIKDQSLQIASKDKLIAKQKDQNLK